jgi:peptidoglycan glycosyltransferase
VNALRRSCNTTFGSIALELGDDALRRQAQKFGFDSDKLEIPMDVAASAFPDNPNEPQTAQSAIGQFDVRATPLQMAMVVAGIANGGVVMKPYLVDRILAQDTTPIETTRPEELSEAVSGQVAQQLTDMLVDVVENGTGSNARIEGVRVAGKTGTAQQGRNKPPHAWFVSFAPAEDPQVAVAVVIEDGGGVDRAEVGGNRLAAPIARDVMAAVRAAVRTRVSTVEGSRVGTVGGVTGAVRLSRRRTAGDVTGKGFW